jgi:hypothetical protein
MVLGLAACSRTETTMPGKTVAGYGAWKSPLTAARVTVGALRFDHLVLDGDDLYWVEGRASEGGRHVIVRREPSGRITDVTPQGFSARSRVHEYGGASYTVRGGIVFFTNFADQRLYRQAPADTPVPLTAEGYYYADCRVDLARSRLVCVREDHSKTGEPVNSIVAVGMHVPARAGTHSDLVLVSGADFYSDPIVSPDGSRLAWLQWDHPNMPWDGTELWTADIKADGSLLSKVKVAGGKDESIFQPEWSPDGTLYFVSDRTGYWNLYRQLKTGADALHPMPAEFQPGDLLVSDGESAGVVLHHRRPLEDGAARDRPSPLRTDRSATRAHRRDRGDHTRGVLHWWIADRTDSCCPHDDCGSGGGGDPVVHHRSGRARVDLDG